MSNTIKVSGAQIIRPMETEIIQLVGYSNPEIILPNLIRDYFTRVGYMSMYPNFKTIRIGAIHPFAVLLYQEVSGQQLDVSLFPSITIADTSDSENYQTLSRDIRETTFNESDVANLKYEVQKKTILTSDENIARLELATANGATVPCKIHSYRANHNIDLNIWGDNKDMVSLIYDLLKHCIISNINELHNLGIDVEGAVTGRRSGDINVEFGKLLYGANVTIPATITTHSMYVDITSNEVKYINARGNYFTEGGENG